MVAGPTREMGIRLARGATPGAVRSHVLREALRPVALGIAAGVAGSLPLSRTLTGSPYRVEPTDPVTLVAVVGLLLGVAVRASWVPAARSTRVDPRIAIQAD